MSGGRYYFLAGLFLLLTLFLIYFNLGPLLLKDNIFSRFPFKLGLDLQGGSHLVYSADVSVIKEGEKEKKEAMAGLRDVIERRINLFGVSEPIVQIERKGEDRRLIVELAGVYDVDKAIQMIGETPYLEFKTQREENETQEILNAQKNNKRLLEDPYFKTTPLTGRFLKKAALDFDPTTFKPLVSIEFDDTGRKLFAQLTKENIGKPIAIYLDGAPISVPIVREEIVNGRAQISGNFKPEEAKLLVQRLNSGALPIPISLISQERIGPTLGRDSINASIKAGIIGLILLALYILIYYRLFGLIAIFALLFYLAFVLTIFKMIPVTLTLAGLIGFLMSLGMAVDANILIFERTKEEIRQGKDMAVAVEDGFKRAWKAIKDSNFTTILVALILFWLGTSAIKGFALTLMIGVAVSMLSSVWLTRIYMKAFVKLRK